MFLSKISQNQIFVVSFLAHVTMTRPGSCSLLWLVLAETTTTWTPLRTWTPPEVTGCWCMEAAYSYCSGRRICERNGPTKQLPVKGTVLFIFSPLQQPLEGGEVWTNWCAWKLYFGEGRLTIAMRWSEVFNSSCNCCFSNFLCGNRVINAKSLERRALSQIWFPWLHFSCMPRSLLFFFLKITFHQNICPILWKTRKICVPKILICMSQSTSGRTLQ